MAGDRFKTGQPFNSKRCRSLANPAASKRESDGTISPPFCSALLPVGATAVERVVPLLTVVSTFADIHSITDGISGQLRLVGWRRVGLPAGGVATAL